MIEYVQLDYWEHIDQNTTIFIHESAFQNVVCYIADISSQPQWLKSIMREANDVPLQWRHNERDGVSDHQPHHC